MTVNTKKPTNTRQRSNPGLGEYSKETEEDCEENIEAQKDGSEKALGVWYLQHSTTSTKGHTLTHGQNTQRGLL